jgi:DNA-binding NtrC family response regulator/predicted hydrocarbon binding protein
MHSTATLATVITADSTVQLPADGPRPSLRDLAGHLHFSPEDGRIWLDGQRMLLLRASTLGSMRRELIERLGLSGARAVLTRIGYTSGARDAELVRKRWPGEYDVGAFTAGTRLHALEGMVKVSTLSMHCDIPRGVFHGEYLWNDSFEASDHISAYGIASEPVCWMQLGYAAGYASAFLGKLVLFRETECLATGAPACRVTGQPADAWKDAGDDLRYLNADLYARSGAPARRTTRRTAPAPASTGSAPGHAADGAGMVGVSAAFSVARQMLDRVAPTRATVLFAGESGVGKELFARALHQVSPRAGKPFVAVNCAAIPDTLIESELFGVDKGAYTGATSSRPGRFERADGGTLFLDEIPSLSLVAQGKLLRAVQEQEIDRVGGVRSIHVDVRVVVATNRDLKAEVQAGRFREDLYYRLNVFPISLPPLRDRRDDIPLLIEHFLSMYNRLHGKKVIGLQQRAIEALLNYDYPGNIRELQNIVERGVISTPDDCAIELYHLFHQGEAPSRRSYSVGQTGTLHESAAAPPPDAIAALLADGNFSLVEHEKAMYSSALAGSNGNVAGAARRLGLTRAQLAYRLRLHGLLNGRHGHAARRD